MDVVKEKSELSTKPLMNWDISKLSSDNEQLVGLSKVSELGARIYSVPVLHSGISSKKTKSPYKRSR